MKVVILCGGQGTRLREETEVKPKPMVAIGGMPILWHIMMTYAYYGFKDFVLCLGYKAEVIKKYFSNSNVNGWNVTLADTGETAMTGARIKRIEKYIDTDTFMLTYGDGVTDIDIDQLLTFHKSHGKIGTLSGVFPQSRYGELLIEDDRVLSFDEKPARSRNLISGGYFVFSKKMFEYVRDDDECVLEREALHTLAKEDQLKVYRHEGFWQCMDTYRDYTYLQRLCQTGEALWKKW